MYHENPVTWRLRGYWANAKGFSGPELRVKPSIISSRVQYSNSSHLGYDTSRGLDRKTKLLVAPSFTWAAIGAVDQLPGGRYITRHDTTSPNVVQDFSVFQVILYVNVHGNRAGLPSLS